MMRARSCAIHDLRPMPVSVLLVALGLVAPVAQAEGMTPVARDGASPAAAPVATGVPPTDVTVGGGVGGMTEGVLIEASCLVRLYFIDLGVDVGGGGLFASVSSASALAGVGFRTHSGL